jgi:hypothetical protein
MYEEVWSKISHTDEIKYNTNGQILLNIIPFGIHPSYIDSMIPMTLLFLPAHHLQLPTNFGKILYCIFLCFIY